MSTIAVIIATRGRPALVRQVVDRLSYQTRPADRIFVVGSQADDVAALDRGRPDLTAVVGRTGLPLQRNDGLRLASDAFDCVVFFDDDFVPSRFWLENVEIAFATRPDIVGLTGTVLADGAKTPGIAFEDGAMLVAERDAAPSGDRAFHEGFGPYGCNMAFRTAAIRGLAFDERLPLYGWLEDSDFGGQVARSGGKTARADALWGVHLGNKTGRERGLRLGYSQIANPLYLARKGTLPLSFLVNLMLRNVGANLLRSVAPEPYVDRPGRLRGNLVALVDVVRGRLAPERVMKL